MDVSVAGRSFMITGANSGIGKAAAIAIAKKGLWVSAGVRGGIIHMVCRNKERAEQAREEVYGETGNKVILKTPPLSRHGNTGLPDAPETDIYVHILDMSLAQKVWEFAETFKKRHRSLNVLINNAGCMVNQREVTAEGLEKNFATNTLGVYILTRSLIPLLEKSSNPRVITVSSGGMLVQKLKTTDLQAENGYFDGTMVYAQNKRQQVVMTERWAKAHRNIHFSCMHPGWADTPAVAMSMPQFHHSMRAKLRTAEQGADTVVWLATSTAAAATPSGLFFQGARGRRGLLTSDREPVPTHLPLAWTRSSPEEEQNFMFQLEEITKSFRPARLTRFSPVSS
ncbi:hypothetical protein JZ751_016203 [Albula glossodonta]|uniref:Dehydrogenase/reductase SDR family member 12 n=1 Tax=Albula glossodonta TaxID=121402 RepID=A0A8T2MS26_9TELE|nr:hypothetical protein JZ751_016203 [Albula glossodonta]